jgi:D-alanyl-D-alanine carboxypeptidase
LPLAALLACVGTSAVESGVAAAVSRPADAVLTRSVDAAPTVSPTPTTAIDRGPAERPAVDQAASTDPVSRASTSFDRATRRRLKRILRNTVNKSGIAGLSVAVRSPDGDIWTGVAGHAEFAPDRRVERDTAFAIASVTKTFVAALILQLAEEGKVELDVPFGTYFTDAPGKNKVTVRQLLSHTSGLYDYFENPRYLRISGSWLGKARSRGLAAREHRWTYPEIMRLVGRRYCEPGKCYHYSNTNYVILGKIAAAVSGAPLPRQLRERFFHPLGMADTVYQPAELPPEDAAHGHWARLGGGHIDHTREAEVVPFMAAASVANAAGAIASTPRDLVIWASALYGGDLLSKRSLREMKTILPAGTYGLGTDVATFAGHRGFGHRGGLRGFEASMWHFPKAGYSVALLSNQGNWLTDEPMKKIVEAVLGKA